MIVNIRGTSGSGKSTIVRDVMRQFTCAPVHIKGRKQPLYYVCEHNARVGNELIVLGHYETPCGGCDTITKQDEIYDLIRDQADRGYNVLYEGLLVSAEVNRAQALKDDGYDLLVVLLDLPLEKCIDSVNQRRWAKNPDKPGVNPKNTESKWKGSRRAVERLEEGGVECHRFDLRYRALELVEELLDV